MRTQISRQWAKSARSAALLCLAAIAVAALAAACRDPLPDAGEAPATEARLANDGAETDGSVCNPQEAAAQNAMLELRRARLFRLVLLVSQLEVAARSSEQSLPSDDGPIFPLSAERRALLWTDAVEIDAILTGIDAVLDEMPYEEAQELRIQRHPLKLASAAWADWLVQLIEQGEEAFDEQPESPIPLKTRDLFNGLLAEIDSLDAQSACPKSPKGGATSGDAARTHPTILRMLTVISLMESEVRSTICVAVGCPLLRGDAPLTAEERAALAHASSRLYTLNNLAWELRSAGPDTLPQALRVNLEAAPVSLDELAYQWAVYARGRAIGSPDALLQRVHYGILGVQTTLFNIYTRHFLFP